MPVDLSVTGVQGRPFRFRLEIENGPASIEVAGLPKGLTLDRETSVISGQPDEAGDFRVLVTVANSDAAERRFLSIRIERPGPE